MNKRKKLLNQMASYSFEEYQESKKEGQIIAEINYDDGFIYVVDNGERLKIYMSFLDESQFEKEDILEYIKDKNRLIYVLINNDNQGLHHQMTKLGFTDMYMSYEMQNQKIQPYDGVLSLETYDDDRFDDYIDVLSSFSPMRKSLNLKPFDWYRSNLTEARIKFQGHASEDNFYSYSIDHQIVAVLMMNHNEIDTIAVHVDFQKKSIGEALLRTGMNILCSRGYSSLVLSVMAVNERAMGLYEKVGFEKASGMIVMKNKRTGETNE